MPKNQRTEPHHSARGHTSFLHEKPKGHCLCPQQVPTQASSSVPWTPPLVNIGDPLLILTHSRATHVTVRKGCHTWASKEGSKPASWSPEERRKQNTWVERILSWPPTSTAATGRLHKWSESVSSSVRGDICSMRSMCEVLTHFKEEFNTISDLSLLGGKHPCNLPFLYIFIKVCQCSLRAQGLGNCQGGGSASISQVLCLHSEGSYAWVAYGTFWEGNSRSPSHKTQSMHPLPRKGNGAIHPLPRKGNGAHIKAGANSTCACHGESTHGPSGKRLAT